MVLMGDGGPKQGHDTVAHHLVHRPLVAVHRLHHALEHRVEQLACLLGVPIRQQLHRPFQVREEDRHLLALPFQSYLRLEDLLRQMPRGVTERRLGTWGRGLGLRGWHLSAEGCGTLAAERKPGRVLKATLRALGTERGAALAAKLHASRILKPTARAAHGPPLVDGNESCRVTFAGGSMPRLPLGRIDRMACKEIAQNPV